MFILLEHCMEKKKLMQFMNLYLITHCMKMLQMMKRERLEQVNWILRSPDARADKNFKTISEIAQHYRFQSRGHFAKAYQQIFHETPSETWLKSANV